MSFIFIIIQLVFTLFSEKPKQTNTDVVRASVRIGSIRQEPLEKESYMDYSEICRNKCNLINRVAE